MKDRKALLEEAYRFGYFIGLKGHSEWAEWVRKKREELYQKAEEFGIYELVKEAYRRGKEEGKKVREEMLYEGLSGKPEGKEKRMSTYQEKRVESDFEEDLSEIEIDYLEFLRSTKLAIPPEFLDSLRNLEPPKMLHFKD
ncbi:hypothetical protein [Thermococcus sp.]